MLVQGRGPPLAKSEAHLDYQKPHDSSLRGCTTLRAARRASRVGPFLPVNGSSDDITPLDASPSAKWHARGGRVDGVRPLALGRAKAAGSRSRQRIAGILARLRGNAARGRALGYPRWRPGARSTSSKPQAIFAWSPLPTLTPRRSTRPYLARSYPFDPAAPHGLPSVLRSGRGLLYSTVQDAWRARRPAAPNTWR